MSPILVTSGLGLDYGKFTAVTAVDLAVTPNSVHSLIGPNGAGKTSFFNIVSGRHRPSRGSIRFAGHDITATPSHRRVRLGMARSFQVTSLFAGESVRHNLRLAALGLSPARALHFWRTWNGETQDLTAVDEVLQRLELGALAERKVGALSHGLQRIVEIGMCLVARPRLLLFDEPLAGLGLDDVPRVAALMRDLARTHTVLLVEHNMRVVMSISDRITVMFQGGVIAEGSPEEIRASAEVRRVYLGSAA